MNKQVLLLSALVIGMIYAKGQNANVLNELQKQQTDNSKKFIEFSKKSEQKNGNNLLTEDQNEATLAGFLNNKPYFYQQDDFRANTGIGATILQTQGIDGHTLNGENINILVMDGGRAFEAHTEFRDLNVVDSTSTTGYASRLKYLDSPTTTFAAHPTSVSSFIAAEGVSNLTAGTTQYPNGAKGVIPKAKINNYSFSTTALGNNFVKLLNADANISNHSYGINLGWNLYSASSSPIGKAGWFYFDENIANEYEDENATFSGSYYANDYNYDLIAYNNPKNVIVKSAGNSFGDGPFGPNDPNGTLPVYVKKLKEGTQNTYEYALVSEGEIVPAYNCANDAPCIGWGSLAKNIITVGSNILPNTADYRFTDTSKDYKSYFSSAGPRKDGGIKPEISTYGEDVVSATSNAAGSISFSIGSGTSYSAPKVSGSIGMLTQLQRLLKGDQSYSFYGDEAKALILHTADEAGDFDGPDTYFGWGMLNTLKAAEVLVDENTVFERSLKKSGENKTYDLISDGTPLKASISWLDVPGQYSNTYDYLLYDTTSRLVNDFDIRVTDSETGEVFLPWKLDLANIAGAAVKGDNTVDNYEQVLISNPTQGRKYTVTVSNKGTLTNGTSEEDQNFTILVTGVKKEDLSNNDLTSNSLQVYPTVTSDYVNIQSSNHNIIKVNLIDLNGRVVATKKSVNKIDVSSFTPGVYVLSIETDKGLINKKIIKK